jgi:hypothetical protein
MSSYPALFRVRQRFDTPRIDDVPQAVQAGLERLSLAQRIRPGDSVAITAGSRGIANIAVILKAIVDHVWTLGAEPFLVPAMGSHGGGTVEGQIDILQRYGVTEEFCGCPIRATMETVVVCEVAEGFPVHFDRIAYQADHVIVCNRVKPHTDFVGDIESGLMKMLLIGLGKHKGAKIYHRAIWDTSFGHIVRSVAREVLSKCRIAAGVAVVENANDETGLIEAVPPDQIEQREPALLRQARRWMPRLPFREADILVIDEIGKDISGTGMDTNVVGRKFGIHRAGADEAPQIRHIVVRGLSAGTHGNATGLGLAEFCRSRTLQQRDETKTRINCLTAGRPFGAMTPLDYETDREILDAALPTIGLTEPQDAKLMWIRNTLDVAEVECSAAYLQEARDRHDLQVVSPLRPLPLDEEGNLPDRMGSDLTTVAGETEPSD